MRYVAGLLIGALIGGLTAMLFLLNNPLAPSRAADNPSAAALQIPVAGQSTAVVMESATGYPWIESTPADARKPDVKGASSAVSVLLSTAANSRDIVYATRVRTLTGDRRPISGEVLESSFWHIVVPGRGSLAIYSQDDVWPLIDQFLIPFSMGDAWSGDINYVSSVGPAKNSARITGLSGQFAGRTGTATMHQRIRAAMPGRGITDQDASLSLMISPVPEVAAGIE